MVDTKRDEMATITTQIDPQMQNLMLVTDFQGFDGLEQTEFDVKKSACDRRDTDGCEIGPFEVNGQTNDS